MATVSLSTTARVDKILFAHSYAPEQAKQILANPDNQPVLSSLTHLSRSANQLVDKFEGIPNVKPFCDEMEAGTRRLKASKPKMASQFEKQFTQRQAETQDWMIKKDQTGNKVELFIALLKRDSAALMEIIKNAIINKQSLPDMKQGKTTIADTLAKQKSQLVERNSDVDLVKKMSEKLIKSLQAQNSIINSETKGATPDGPAPTGQIQQPGASSS